MLITQHHIPLLYFSLNNDDVLRSVKLRKTSTNNSEIAVTRLPEQSVCTVSWLNTEGEIDYTNYGYLFSGCPYARPTLTNDWTMVNIGFTSFTYIQVKMLSWVLKHNQKGKKEKNKQGKKKNSRKKIVCMGFWYTCVTMYNVTVTQYGNRWFNESYLLVCNHGNVTLFTILVK